MGTETRGFDTHFDGYKFRSRLEARWAIFFNEVRIPYSYEPEGFDLGEEGYLPDFFLDVKSSEVVSIIGQGSHGVWHDRGMWVEVKPRALEPFEEYKAKRTCTFTGYPLIVLRGDPAVGPYKMIFPRGPKEPNYGFSWCMCPECHEVGLACLRDSGGDYPWTSKEDGYIRLRCCRQGTIVGLQDRVELCLEAIEAGVRRAREARFGVWE